MCCGCGKDVKLYQENTTTNEIAEKTKIGNKLKSHPTYYIPL